MLRELTRRTTFADDLDDWVLGFGDIGGFFDSDDEQTHDDDADEDTDE